MQKSILHIPHSSTKIPMTNGYVVDQEVLDREILKLTDWYTDDLFSLVGSIQVRADFSRIFCDTERFTDDSLEVMAKFGMGVLYEKANSLVKLNTGESPYIEPILLPGAASKTSRDGGVTSSFERPEVPELGIKIFPNPSDGKLSIEWDPSKFIGNEKLSMSLVNSQGQEVYSLDFEDLSRGFEGIDLTHLPSGSYVMTLNSGESKIYSTGIILNTK